MAPTSPSLAATHPVDAAALDAYLAQNLDGYAGPVRIERFSGGQSNPTYRLDTPDRSYVMRCKPGSKASKAR